MKYQLLLSTALISLSICSTAQNNSRTYAITGKLNNSFLWADIKQVDITTGKVSKVLFEADKTSFKSTSLDKTGSIASRPGNNSSPTGFGVAACALDTKHNRLYFATMHFADIRYLDLNKPDANFTTIKTNAIEISARGGFQPEENHITRMVIAADGFGYALTNDANHLIRFSTDKNPEVKDLGSLSDAESNKGISIHNKCSSWGGDMVADAFGKLVIVSASHNVFTVDISSRTASLTGTISGLPAKFTTNGAAVDDDGNLVVSSANVFDGLFKVNFKGLSAVKIESQEPSFNASDLANGNLLSQKEANALSNYNPVRYNFNDDGRVYPNPVTGTQFNVDFENQPAGKYIIVLTDISGRAVQSKQVIVSKQGQVEPIRFNSKASNGMYFVKVITDKKQLAFSEKIVVN